MKNRLLFFFIFVNFCFLISAQKTNKQLLLFENEEIIIKYPANWVHMKLSNNPKIVFEPIVSLETKVRAKGKYKGVPLNTFTISKKQFVNKNFEDFINNLKKSENIYFASANLKIDQDIFKIKDNRYSVISKTSNINKSGNSRAIETHSLVHYILHNDYLYLLNLTYLSSESSWILDNAVLIFDSFSFKN